MSPETKAAHGQRSSAAEGLTETYRQETGVAKARDKAKFRDSQEAAFRRVVRDAVRNGGFTKGERDVTLALVNHWFHHRAKGPIHPGREKLAKVAGVTIKTVSRTLGNLRAAMVILPVNEAFGGKAKATEYTVNIHMLLNLCGCDWLDNFTRKSGANVPVSGGEMSRYARDKMSHRIKVTSRGPQASEAEG